MQSYVTLLSNAILFNQSRVLFGQKEKNSKGNSHQGSLGPVARNPPGANAITKFAEILRHAFDLAPFCCKYCFFLFTFADIMFLFYRE